MLLIADKVLLVNNISSKRQNRKKDVLILLSMIPFSKMQIWYAKSYSVTISANLKTKLPICIFR